MGGEGAGEGLFLRRRATNTPAITSSRTRAALAPPRATSTASGGEMVRLLKFLSGGPDQRGHSPKAYGKRDGIARALHFY